jgi:hypothetical protein
MTEHKSAVGAIRLYIQPDDYLKLARGGYCVIQNGNEKLVIFSQKAIRYPKTPLDELERGGYLYEPI